MNKMLSRSMILSTIFAAGAIGVACSKPAASTTEPEAAATPAEPAQTEPAQETADNGADVPWAQKSHEQKAHVMKTVVTPTLGASFREFSPEHFAEFNCSTCHGPAAKESNFEMPTPSIEPLVDFQTAMNDHPEVTKFMAERVVPETAKALGVAPYNPETHEGFGCFNCHTKAN